MAGVPLQRGRCGRQRHRAVFAHEFGPHVVAIAGVEKGFDVDHDAAAAFEHHELRRPALDAPGRRGVTTVAAANSSSSSQRATSISCTAALAITRSEVMKCGATALRCMQCMNSGRPSRLLSQALLHRQVAGIEAPHETDLDQPPPGRASRPP